MRVHVILLDPPGQRIITTCFKGYYLFKFEFITVCFLHCNGPPEMDKLLDKTGKIKDLQ